MTMLPLLTRYPLRLSAFVLLAFTALTPVDAFAACASPAGNAGDINYSSTQNVMVYCNGTTWINMGAAGAASFGTLTTGNLCTATSSTGIACTTSAINLATQVTGTLPVADLPALASGNLWVGNGSAVATAVAASGDCTISNAGAITCTKTNGTAFGALATLAPTGTASSTTFLRGDGTWAAAGNGTVTSSTAGQVAYFASTGTTVVGTSALFVSGSAVAVGTTTTNGALNVNGTVNAAAFAGSGAALTGIGTSALGGITGSASSTTYLRGDGTWAAASGLPTLTAANIWVGNSSNVATAVTASGDCTISNAGAFTCTKTSGTAFGALATMAPTGTANSTTYLRGDGTWATVSSGGSLSGGTANYIPVWTSATAIGTSALYQSSNYVGIGTTVPLAQFETNSTGNTSVATAVPYYNATAAQSVNVDSDLHYDTITAASGQTRELNGFDYTYVNPSAALSQAVFARSSQTEIAAANTYTLSGIIYGLQGAAVNAGTGSLTNALMGVQGNANNLGAATVSTSYGLYSGGQNSAAGGTITNQYGLYSVYSNTGTVTNGYGIYITGEGTGGTWTNKAYDIYAADTGVYNYFAGNVGIGTATANTALQVNGTASASVVNVVPQAVSITTGGVTGGVSVNSGTTNQLAYYSGANTVAGGGVYLSSGSVGIGTAVPTATLDVYEGQSMLRNDTFYTLSKIETDSTSYSPFIIFHRGRGTLASPSYVQSGDTMGSINFRDSLETSSGAGIISTATETHTSTAAGANLTFSTVANTTLTQAERMRIDQGGNVGIGTATPLAPLDIWQNVGTGNALLRIANTNTGTTSGQGAAIQFAQAGNSNWAQITRNFQDGNLYFYQTGGGNAMVLSNSGGVGIGTAIPAEKLDVAGNIVVANGSGYRFKNTSGTSVAALNIDSSNTVRLNGAGSTVHINPDENQVTYLNYNNSSPVVIGNGTTGGNFYVNTSSGSGVNGEIMHLVTPSDGIRVDVNNTGTNGAGLFVNRTGSAGYLEIFYYGGSGGVGSINTNGSSVSFNTTSDRRIKENIKLSSRGLDALAKITVNDFNFIADPKKQNVQGFIAQDLYKVYPEAVTINGDDGTKPLAKGAQPWSVDYGRVTPLLAKAIQELKALFDTDHGRLAKLETENTEQAAAIKQLRADFEAYKKVHP